MTAIYVLGAIIVAGLIAVLVAVLVLLKRIDDQFSSNTGHTIRDATNRLEAVGNVAGQQLSRLTAMLNAVSATTLRIEEAAGTDRSAVRGVASDLAATQVKAQEALDLVAADLAVAQAAVYDLAADVLERTKRADQTKGEPGEAGDAFAGSGGP